MFPCHKVEGLGHKMKGRNVVQKNVQVELSATDGVVFNTVNDEPQPSLPTITGGDASASLSIEGEDAKKYFEVGERDGQVTVVWRSGGQQSYNNNAPHTFRVKVMYGAYEIGQFEVTIKNKTPPAPSTSDSNSDSESESDKVKQLLTLLLIFHTKSCFASFSLSLVFSYLVVLCPVIVPPGIRTREEDYGSMERSQKERSLPASGTF